MGQIKLIICDFDGTLVDTFEANYRAYNRAFSDVGLTLSRNTYLDCFGLRFDCFMEMVGIKEKSIALRIKELKGNYYPQYFEYLRVNNTLLNFVSAFHQQGGKTAIASTARGKNLRNALEYIGALDIFDIVLAGEDVQHGKPSPEIYQTILEQMRIAPDNALVFEDSEVGCQAAENAGIRYIKIEKEFYGN